MLKMFHILIFVNNNILHECSLKGPFDNCRCHIYYLSHKQQNIILFYQLAYAIHNASMSHAGAESPALEKPAVVRHPIWQHANRVKAQTTLYWNYLYLCVLCRTFLLPATSRIHVKVGLSLYIIIIFLTVSSLSFCIKNIFLKEVLKLLNGVAVTKCKFLPL